MRTTTINLYLSDMYRNKPEEFKQLYWDNQCLYYNVTAMAEDIQNTLSELEPETPEWDEEANQIHDTVTDWCGRNNIKIS